MTKTMPAAAAAALAELADATRAEPQYAAAQTRVQDVLPQVQQAVESFLQSGAGRPLRLRSEAADAFLTAAAKLDEADKLERLAELRAVLAEANAEAEAAWAQEERLAAELAIATEAERAAKERAQSAGENREQAAQRETWARQYGADAPVQTEALMRARAAADVFVREQAAYEGATAARVQAEQMLAEVRTRTAELERKQDAAAAALKDPGRIAPSPCTLAMDGIRRYMAGDKLTLDEEAVISVFVDTMARRLGLHHVYANTALERAEQQRKHEVSGTPITR